MKVNRQSIKQFFISSAMGGTAALSFPPFFLIPVFLINYGWLYYKCRGEKAFQRSLVFFTAFFVALLYWIVNPLTFDLKHHAILIPFAILAAPMFFAAQFAGIMYLWKKYFQYNGLCRVFSFSAGILGVIFFISEVFPSFPWILPAYICCGHEIFMQTLSVFGVYGLSSVILFLSALTGELFVNYRENRTRNAYIYAGIIALTMSIMLVFGYFRLKNHPTQFTQISARLVQCNIPQKDKQNKRLSFEILQKHIQLSAHKNDVDFVIWAEAAVPYLYRENFDELHDYLAMPLHENEILITGVVRRDLKTSLIYNSIVAINKNKQNVAVCDKSKLVPFGEYIPCRRLLSISPLAAEIEDFDVGATPKIFKLKGINVLFSNCYEIAFRQKRENADVLINLTNDGWFGHTTELFQHLAIARARATELGLPVIRVTNFGITAVYDPCGRCLGQISAGKSGTLDIKIPKKID